MKYIFYLIILFVVCNRIADQAPLEHGLEEKFVREIESEHVDHRHQEIQELESQLETEGNAFVDNGLQDFKTLLSETDDTYTKYLIEKIKYLLGLSTVYKKIESISNDFKLYVRGIEESNKILLDKVIASDKKINPVDSDTAVHFMDVLSQTIKCRVKTVSAINWIGARLKYIKNRNDWMSIREELIKLLQKYRAIETNLNKYLISINKMITNGDQMDQIEVEKAFDYLKGLIYEEFYSMTEDMIKMTERLGIKPKTTKEIEDESRVESDLSFRHLDEFEVSSVSTSFNRRSRNIRMFDF